MKRSVIGERLADLMRSTPEPLTTTEMAEAAAPCSVQRAYAWVVANKANLVAMGVSPTGGTLYVGRDNPIAPRYAVSRSARSHNGHHGQDGDRAGVLEVGTALTITRILLGEGVVVELETEDGRRVEATLHV